VKTLLIIGGTGFFGKSFIDSFGRGMLDKWSVTKILIISRDPRNLSVEAPELLDPRIELVAMDIGNAVTLPDADYVIHAAASTNAARYLSQPSLERANIQSGISNYVKLATKFHKNSKILYVSSGAIYGVGLNETSGFNEDCVGGNLDLIPIGKRDYAAAKIDAENCMRELGESGLQVAIGRCFAFVGPYLPRNQHFAVGNFIGDGLSRRNIKVSARHLVYRSYMHADDLVEWLMTLCSAASSACPIYNVGSDEVIEIGQLAHNVAKFFGVTVEISQDRLSEFDFYVPKIEKAKKNLGLRLKYTLAESLNSTITRLLK